MPTQMGLWIPWGEGEVGVQSPTLPAQVFPGMLSSGTLSP